MNTESWIAIVINACVIAAMVALARIQGDEQLRLAGRFPLGALPGCVLLIAFAFSLGARAKGDSGVLWSGLRVGLFAAPMLSVFTTLPAGLALSKVVGHVKQAGNKNGFFLFAFAMTAIFTFLGTKLVDAFMTEGGYIKSDNPVATICALLSAFGVAGGMALSLRGTNASAAAGTPDVPPDPLLGRTSQPPVVNNMAPGVPGPSLAAAPVEEATKACPFCAEKIKAVAIKCRFCGELLKTPT